MKPPGSANECDVDGRFVRTLRLPDANSDDGFGSAVSARDTGRFGVMKP
jgi:hypothetical protein